MDPLNRSTLFPYFYRKKKIFLEKISEKSLIESIKLNYYQPKIKLQFLVPLLLSNQKFYNTGQNFKLQSWNDYFL